MAKERSKEVASKGRSKAKGEGVGRSQMVYAFNQEKARKLRDENYKGKTSMVASLIIALCKAGKAGYTYNQMSDLLAKEFGEKVTRAQFPMNKLRNEGLVKPSKERVAGEASAAATPKGKAKGRKPQAEAPQASAPNGSEGAEASA